MNIAETISQYGIATSTDFNQLFINILIALLVVILGVILGKVVSSVLKKLSQKIELNKHIRGSFIDLLIVVIRWSIYIVFIHLGLKQLEISVLTTYFTRILITIPAFTGALIILTIGFALAIYLRDVIEDAEVTGWDLISKVVFYFVLYVFGVYALNTALFSFDEFTTNLIIVILTAVIASGIAYVVVKKEIRRENGK